MSAARKRAARAKPHDPRTELLELVGGATDAARLLARLAPGNKDLETVAMLLEEARELAKDAVLALGATRRGDREDLDERIAAASMFAVPRIRKTRPIKGSDVVTMLMGAGALALWNRDASAFELDAVARVELAKQRPPRREEWLNAHGWAKASVARLATVLAAILREHGALLKIEPADVDELAIRVRLEDDVEADRTAKRGVKLALLVCGYKDARKLERRTRT